MNNLGTSLLGRSIRGAQPQFQTKMEDLPMEVLLQIAKDLSRGDLFNLIFISRWMAPKFQAVLLHDVVTYSLRELNILCRRLKMPTYQFNPTLSLLPRPGDSIRSATIHIPETSEMSDEEGVDSLLNMWQLLSMTKKHKINLVWVEKELVDGRTICSYHRPYHHQEQIEHRSRIIYESLRSIPAKPGMLGKDQYQSMKRWNPNLFCPGEQKISSLEIIRTSMKHWCLAPQLREHLSNTTHLFLWDGHSSWGSPNKDDTWRLFHQDEHFCPIIRDFGKDVGHMEICLQRICHEIFPPMPESEVMEIAGPANVRKIHVMEGLCHGAVEWSRMLDHGRARDRLGEDWQLTTEPTVFY